MSVAAEKLNKQMIVALADREAKERINAAFDRTIQKLRSTQAALRLVPDSTGAGGRPR